MERERKQAGGRVQAEHEGKRGDAERWFWPTGQEASLAEMPKLHRDQAAGRETETQPLGGEV